MDISKEAQIILRDGGYDTWEWNDASVPIVYFENDVILGFIYLFNDIDYLKNSWEELQQIVIDKFKPNFKAAGNKAWNVYSIFLSTSESEDSVTLDYIEENFNHTRKIARSNIVSKESLKNALLSILPLVNKPILDEFTFNDALRANLARIREDAAEAFMNDVDVEIIAQIMAENHEN